MLRAAHGGAISHGDAFEAEGYGDHRGAPVNVQRDRSDALARGPYAATVRRLERSRTFISFTS